MLVVMDGAMTFAADLSRALRTPHKVESIKCKSYEDGVRGKHLKITQDGHLDGSRLLIVEDIIDSGRTMRYTKQALIRNHDPINEVRVVSLIERAHHDPVADWIGFKIGPGFIYGYGLDDEKGLGRGLGSIWVRGVDLGRSR